MLREILALFQQYQGRTLSREAVRAYLDVSPELLDQMLLTLVRLGRLVEVTGCTGCEACPLEKFCGTSPALTTTGYTLAQPEGEGVKG